MRATACRALFALLAVCNSSALETCSAHLSSEETRVCGNPECSEQKLTTNRSQFKSPKGLFVQEQATAQLTHAGQHPNFGSRLPWSEVLEQIVKDRKLVFLIRHGEAVSNAVQSYVGLETWQSVTTQCSWKNSSSGEELQLYDPPLTEKGQLQATTLQQILSDGKTKLTDLTGGRRYKIVVSPLSRTLQTYSLALRSLATGISPMVDEFCRERFGHNTCDARRPIFLTNGTTTSHPPINSRAGESEDAGPYRAEGEGQKKQQKHAIRCAVGQPLEQKFPDIDFRIIHGADSQLGLVANADPWWTDNERESNEAIRARAHAFLTRLFEHVEETIVFVVSHSGMIGAVLEAMGRQRYSAQNAELVPALVERRVLQTM